MKKFVICCIVFCIALFFHTQAERISTLFAPADKPTKTLLELIDGAKKSIHIAMYMLTDKTIAEAIVAKSKNCKIDIKIILDPASTDRRFGKADFLVQNGINVSVFDRDKILAAKNSTSDKSWFDPIMHNKFMIIDSSILWTGSFNWTVSANTSNQENVIIINDRTICKKYEDVFNELLSTKCKPHQSITHKNGDKSSLRERIRDVLENTRDDKLLFETIYNLLHIHVN